MVEFALILVPLLIVVSGIIYFGIGLNYWLDMNRVANQGARQAVVNHWGPQCPRGETSCNQTKTNCGSTSTGYLQPGSRGSLQNVLRCQTRNTSTTATICYPGYTSATVANVTIGDPVRVKLTAPYTFFFMRRLGITLTATATMRLEQKPTLITGAITGSGGVCP